MKFATVLRPLVLAHGMHILYLPDVLVSMGSGIFGVHKVRNTFVALKKYFRRQIFLPLVCYI